MTLKQILLSLVLAAFSTAPLAAAEKPKNYPFTEPPVAVVDRVAKANLVSIQTFDTDERKFLNELFALRTSAKPNEISFALEVQSHLFAAGLTDSLSREIYAAWLERIIDEAKVVVEGEKTPAGKADKLLRHLHAGPMVGGYHAESTTLVELLDTGKFNCVSSTAFYYLVGRRVGLELVPILIDGIGGAAGHASIDLLVDGQRTDVETTCLEGFGLAEKNRGKRAVGFSAAPDRSKAYDSNGIGLVSSTLGNRASAMRSGGHSPEDYIRFHAVELSFDPTNANAYQNLQATFVNWGLKLLEDAEYEKALTVSNLAETVMPHEKKSRHNHGVIWTKYIVAEIAAGRDKEVVRLVLRARGALPESNEFKTAARWFAIAARNVEGQKRGRSWSEA